MKKFKDIAPPELEAMLLDWRRQHPDGDQLELAEWLFDTFEDLELASRRLLNRMAFDYMQWLKQQ